MNLQVEFLMSLCFAFDVCRIVFRPGERLPMKKGGTQNIKSQARHTSSWNMQSSNIMIIAIIMQCSNISPLFLKFCLDVGCVNSSISDSAPLGVVCRLWLGSNGKLHIDTSLQAHSEKQKGQRFQMVRDGHM